MRTIALAVFIAALPSSAQQKSLSCDSSSYNNGRLVSHCEMRETTVGYAGRLLVDGAVTSALVTVLKVPKGRGRRDRVGLVVAVIVERDMNERVVGQT